ncbi:lytic murein transglycosylase [Vibrio palustris]|uniref:Membrane-bound lytic murein transglycosylase B n=1 Tax=Vibrio palustris TaxID=1918946 RepID=A0A1R4B1N2_9VIBR|nr:lytic murein transglycosylase [Vibrio palustris]SJL82826.1 Membrane-bound lytic murein transglycosylase B precursor [Vibrio palustris]
MRKLLSVILGVTLASPVLAADVSFDKYVEGLKQEARQEGISEQILKEAFNDVKYRPRAVVADRNQPEKKLTLDEYIPRAVPKWKVEKAKALYKKYYPQLQTIGAKYGVQPRFIIALWGVESNFGTFTGGYNVIDALSTMAYDGRREAFFRKQTMAALTILQQGHIDASHMKGSWAGAMGQCQFMPSSFLSFAADGDGDGKKDIWESKADVFASTANYLSQSGWKEHRTWGRQVKLPKGFDVSLGGRSASQGKYLSEWSKLGITRYDGRALPKLNNDIKAWLIVPDDAQGRVYLVYNNYNVLMKWNRSYYFALAVSHLADAIVF